MAGLRTKEDQEMVSFNTLFDSAILSKSLEIFHGEQEKKIAEFSDSQHEIVGFLSIFVIQISVTVFLYRKSNTIYYALNLNAKMYVDVLFRILALTVVLLYSSNTKMSSRFYANAWNK